MKERDSVTATIEVPVDPKTAFKIFTEEINARWVRGPRNFYDGSRAKAMRFEPGVGGRYLEVYDDATGDALEIGRITIWEPGSRLVYRMSLDDTEVDIRFQAITTGTRVVLEQRIVTGGTKAHFYSGWHNILDWFGERADRKKEEPRAAITVERIAERLGLGSGHASWLAKLDREHTSAGISLPDNDALSALLTRLDFTPEDAVEVLRTIRSAQHDPELWWLIERSHHILARGLANRDDDAKPLPALPSALAVFPIHLILVSIDAIRGCHQEFGIPDDVSWETLSYLGRATAAYRNNHGVIGIDLTRWDWMRFVGWLYQVGRLEVIPYKLRKYPVEAGPLFWYDEQMSGQLGTGFRIGDPALSLHVPANDPLTPKSLDESLRRIRTAFAKVNTGESPQVATCTSWLLDDQLAEYLPADSNIIAFQRRFTFVPGARDNDEAILYLVFGAGHSKDLDALPQHTTLERAVVNHLRLGRHWRIRTGWLSLHE